MLLVLLYILELSTAELALVQSKLQVGLQQVGSKVDTTSQLNNNAIHFVLYSYIVFSRVWGAGAARSRIFLIP